MAGCIFCGDTPTTKTHVFRKAWLERIMPSGPEGFFIHRHVRTGNGAFDVTWNRESFDIQPHAACAACNSGWMHTLEHMGENLVEPCVLGSGRTFAKNTHGTLARWILTCTVVLDQILAEPVVEQPIRDRLRTAWEPPDDCFVWLAGTSEANDTVNAWPRPWLMALASEANGYFCTFRIKHLVAQAFIPLSGSPKDFFFDRSGGTGQHVVQVWPSSGNGAAWPPPLLIHGDQVEEFSRVFER